MGGEEGEGACRYETGMDCKKWLHNIVPGVQVPRGNRNVPLAILVQNHFKMSDDTSLEPRR